MPTYRVREGRRFGAAKQYGPGDLVTLEAHEALGFRDKLQLVAEAEPETPVEDAPQAAPMPEETSTAGEGAQSEEDEPAAEETGEGDAAADDEAVDVPIEMLDALEAAPAAVVVEDEPTAKSHGRKRGR